MTKSSCNRKYTLPFRSYHPVLSALYRASELKQNSTVTAVVMTEKQCKEVRDGKSLETK
jgi:hypothetical protein